MDWNYVIAALIGGAVGAVELLGRYRDAPREALRERAAWLYVGVNATAALTAYHLVIVFAVRFGLPAEATALQLATTRVSASAFGAMAFFRTALFTTKVGDVDVPIGPGLFFQILLNITDRAVDRVRALPRAKDIPGVMQRVAFSKACEALPAFCFGIMQNVSPAEQTAAREQVAIIAQNKDLPDPLKANLLGLLLVNLVGLPALSAAVDALSNDIAPDPIAPLIPPPPEG